jgi:hypothetical protein
MRLLVPENVALRRFTAGQMAQELHGDLQIFGWSLTPAPQPVPESVSNGG